MGTVGVRELARRASAILDELTRKNEPFLVTRRGRVVAYMHPVDPDDFEDYVLANAPEFVRGMELAGRELVDGETMSLEQLEDELDANTETATERAPARPAR